jgi:hypothetical protein
MVCLFVAAGRGRGGGEAPATHEPAAPKPKPAHWTVDELCDFFTAQELGVDIPAIRKEKADGCMLIALVAEGGLGDLGLKSKVHELRIKRGLEDAADDHPSGAQAGTLRALASAWSRYLKLEAVRCCQVG